MYLFFGCAGGHAKTLKRIFCASQAYLMPVQARSVVNGNSTNRLFLLGVRPLWTRSGRCARSRLQFPIVQRWNHLADLSDRSVSNRRSQRRPAHLAWEPHDLASRVRVIIVDQARAPRVTAYSQRRIVQAPLTKNQLTRYEVIGPVDGPLLA